MCSYYQLEEASPTAVNHFLTGLVNSAIGELQQSRCLDVEEVYVRTMKRLHFVS